MTPQSRACGACGGSGSTWAKYADPVDGARVGLSADDARDIAREDPGLVYSVVCPVCLGTGRVSDVMPARDAVADAETLQVVGGRIIGREPFNAIEAKRFAHAAFRAVPGLRS